MSLGTILSEKSLDIATITIDHPPGNTLTLEMLSELTEKVGTIQNDADVRAVIITGAGERFFCAGADVGELRSIDPEDLAERGQVLLHHIEALGKPVLAVINGAAFGGGCELAMSCHLRIAADVARFGLPEVNYGMMSCWGGTQRLPRLVGRTRALHMLLTGETITATQAAQYGLVNSIAPLTELQEAALRLARHLARSAPLAMKAILASVDAGLAEGLQKGLDAERDNFHWVYRTQDAHTGLQAFFAKQKPDFKGK